MATKLSKETKELLKANYAKISNKATTNDLLTLNAGIFRTKNFDIFTIMNNNRGAEGGCNLRRLNNIDMLKDNNMYFKFLEKVLVNRYGIVLDGTHRFLSAKKRNESVIVELCIQPELQTTDENVILNYMSKFNEINTRWSGSDNFSSAFSCGADMAVIIHKHLEDGLFNKRVGSNKHILSPSQIFHVIDMFSNVKGNTTLKRDQYTNNELAKKCKTSTHKQYIDGMMQLNKIIADNTNIDRTFYILKNVVSTLISKDMDVNSVLHKIIANPQSWLSYITKKHFCYNAKHASDYKRVADIIVSNYSKTSTNNIIITNKKLKENV